MKKDTLFKESAFLNNATYLFYYNKLRDLAISRFEYINMPDSIDIRYLELSLLETGCAVLFNDPVLGYLGLKCTIGGALNVYHEPLQREAYADNGFHEMLSIDNSVLMYNNMLRMESATALSLYATKLANLDRTIDVNVRAQKTPVMILCDQKQQLTMEQLYMKYDGNQPYIFGDKSLDLGESVRVLNTNAPFVADRLYEQKQKVWHEALSHLGIYHVYTDKKERLITDEINVATSGIMSERFSALSARKTALEKFNKMYGHSADVKFRETMLLPEKESEVSDEHIYN